MHNPELIPIDIAETEGLPFEAIIQGWQVCPSRNEAGLTKSLVFRKNDRAFRLDITPDPAIDNHRIALAWCHWLESAEVA